MVIPRRLHRVLVWGYEPGPESERWWARFAELHPGWELVTWDDAAVDAGEFELGRLFGSCSSGAQLADLVRIEVLWRQGGVYVDSDVEPLRPFDPLLGMGLFVGTEDGDQHVTNSVIGSAPGHPALRALMDRLLEYDEIPQCYPTNQVTGPLFYSRMFEGRDDVVVVPRVMFYPYNPYIGIERDDDWSRRHVVCIHHWARTWVAPHPPAPRVRRGSGIPKRIERAARRVVRGWVYPVLRHVARQIERPADPGPRGVYTGNNRIVVSTTDGFRLTAIADDISLTPELVTRGWYDDKLLHLLDTIIGPGDWFIDVGANIGLFTLAAAKRVGRWGHVIAIEADPELAELCERNAGMNWYRNVTVTAAAAGATAGTTNYERHPDYRMLSVAGTTDHHGRGVQHGFETITITQTTITDLVPDAIPIRAIKIDVEGGEADVLTGLTPLIDHGRIDYIIMETIRAITGNRWTTLLDHLTHYTTHHGATLHTLDYRGHPHPITTQQLTVIESTSQLLIDFTTT